MSDENTVLVQGNNGSIWCGSNSGTRWLWV